MCPVRIEIIENPGKTNVFFPKSVGLSSKWVETLRKFTVKVRFHRRCPDMHGCGFKAKYLALRHSGQQTYCPGISGSEVEGLNHQKTQEILDIVNRLLFRRGLHGFLRNVIGSFRMTTGLHSTKLPVVKKMPCDVSFFKGI